MSLLTRVSRAAGGALLRATAAGRHRCSKAQHHPQRVHRRLACAGAGKMGVAGSCRRGNTDQDSDGGGSPVSGRKMSTHSNNGCIGDLVEGVICQEDDLPKDGMKSFEFNGEKVLVVHHKGQLSAIGSKCSHYGAPLEKGTLCEGRVRCPWHGACFNVATGDIEDFPGLDSIPKYDIEVAEGQVKVRASKTLLINGKRTKAMAKRDPNNNSSFVIIGGGGAGASCAEALRQEGFTGRVILITQESQLPYDRPKLSKAMDIAPEKILLRSESFYESGDIEVLMGVSAEGVNTEEKMIHLSTGDTVAYEKLFIATGGKPRRLGIAGDQLPNVWVVRSPQDANAVAAAAAQKRVVVVGTSFIGMEVAAFLSSNDRAASVTVIGNTSVPFEYSLGHDVGQRIQEMFEEKGVKFIAKSGVVGISEDEGKASGVTLDSGETVEADVVVLGVGVVPNTEFLETSSIPRNQRGYIPVNEHLETSIPGVFCGGDIAAFPLFIEGGEEVSIGHWQVALGHGHTAALNMTGQNVAVKSVPFFWTVLYGKSLRYTGYGKYDNVIIGGDLENLSFIAYYCRGDKVVSLASLGKDPAAANYAEMLQQGKFLTKQQVVDDGEIALKLKC
ncbi:apoptosis-inducing factor 3-like isoform X1 [Portunus trituberculatus]|uniref:apoptosis-inducing factor 3-like isoform X1 n=2 Tax=Portunus trituberculatus TaxID=210409 RepID=UPI001E1CC9F9|nr:apoptosis-inducing factor 3-like isoform X1 [Portunus trituberculatus]